MPTLAQHDHFIRSGFGYLGSLDTARYRYTDCSNTDVEVEITPAGVTVRHATGDIVQVSDILGLVRLILRSRD